MSIKGRVKRMQNYIASCKLEGTVFTVIEERKLLNAARSGKHEEIAALVVSNTVANI